MGGRASSGILRSQFSEIGAPTPLQEVTWPSSGHSDMAALGPVPQLIPGVWSRSLVGKALTAELLPRKAARKVNGGHGEDWALHGHRDSTLIPSLAAQHGV